MKKILILSIIGLFTTNSFAQKNDTLKVGGITVVIKKKEKGKAKEVTIIDNDDSTNVTTTKPKERTFKLKKKKSNVTTNVFALDIGFNNYEDNTNYGAAGNFLRAVGTQPKPTAADFTLKTGKSVGVNLWLVKQKRNIIRNKEHLGIQYAFGLEHINYRYNSSVSFVNGAPSYAFKDSVSFSKNKLGINYLTVPLMLYINPDGKNKFSFSGGISAGYRINSFNKQKSDARGKDKNRGEFDLNPIKLAIVGDIGFKGFKLFGSYSLTNLFERTNMNVTPYTVGLRYDKW